MARSRLQRWIPPLLAVLILFFTAGPAGAHGIGETAADRSILGFIPVGIEHMLLGWDHLLFVAGVVLVAREARLAATLISLFVLGHSTTLVTATLADWRVDPDLVDVVIALSVVFVAGVGIVGRPERFRLFGAVVVGFGLIHGLGLATRFQDIGVPEDGELGRVIAFNIGIEIGQLTAIAVMAAFAFAVVRLIGPDKTPRAAQLVCAPLFIAGSVAASLIALDAFTAPPEPPRAELSADSACEIDSPTEPIPATGGDHPARSFFEPGEEAPLADFGHSLGDGYVIVLYPPDISATDLEALRAFVESADGRGVLAGADDGDARLRVLQLRDTLTCGRIEVDSVREFTQNWLGPLRG